MESSCSAGGVSQVKEFDYLGILFMSDDGTQNGSMDWGLCQRIEKE